ncbi:hypothetical protein ZWY2020_039573 [Hordeum vulgare]|nr:hypothetical protein ZWY2020_039573 [Hordeum vulgare]
MGGGAAGLEVVADGLNQRQKTAAKINAQYSKDQEAASPVGRRSSATPAPAEYCLGYNLPRYRPLMLLGGTWIWEWREQSGARLAAPPDHRLSLLEIEVALACY